MTVPFRKGNYGKIVKKYALTVSFSVLSPVVIILLISFAQGKQKLSFSGGEFRIVQFTDLHYGAKEALNSQTTKLMETVLDLEKPNFVSFTGDMVSAGDWNYTAGWHKKQWLHWTSPVTNRRIHYGYALGNHDGEGELSRKEVIELDMTNEYSLTQLSPPDISGYSNFVLPVYKSAFSDEVVMNIWFFDSGDYSCYGITGYGCIQNDVVQWYRTKSKELEISQNGMKKGIAFFHIPPQEFMFAWNHYSSVGEKNEDICCQVLNTGILTAMREMGNIIGVFVGHDHDDDFLVDYEGILLGYGRKTGFDSYGPPEHMMRGGRVFVFKEDMTMETYIRQEDGSKDTQKPSFKVTQMQDKCNY